MNIETESTITQEREGIDTQESVEAAAVLAISHEFGVDTSVHESRKEAEAALLRYVEGWWEDETRGAVPMPEDPAQAIEDYFLVHATYEDYEIETP